MKAVEPVDELPNEQDDVMPDHEDIVNIQVDNNSISNHNPTLIQESMPQDELDHAHTPQ